MNQLYDFGYSGASIDKFVNKVYELDAVVIDVRFKPFSRIQVWHRFNLARRLIERYVHVAYLGNENYKGGPTKIVDLDKGITHITHYLTSNSVILLCACRDRHTCHRKAIVEAYESATGIRSIPLTFEESTVNQKPKSDQLTLL